MRPPIKFALKFGLGLAFASSLLVQTQGTQKRPRGSFSADAISLWDGKTVSIPSPDGSQRIVAHRGPEIADFKASLVIDGQPTGDLFGAHVDPEVMWSPDSKAFAETYSDAGAVGLFHLLIYYQDGTKVIEPTDPVRKAFLSHPRACFYPEDPNIGGIEWVNGSSEMLVAAETLPHSNCDGMGTWRAYLIRLPSGEILRSYNQLEAKKLFWRHLGPELRNADDQCIRKPKSCEIRQLHE